MLLSPLAHPFHPLTGEDFNAVIYNNGIPTLQMQESDTDFLRTFSDETLEEAFPPTAQEAAELEAVEVFVNLMANLDMLERTEEATMLVREGLKKRLEAKIGLIRSQELPSPGTPRNHRDRTTTREQQANNKVTKPRVGKRFVKLAVKQQPIQQPRKRP
ncbi:unnamed protein product [Cylindrotheca closterium]|uniref:Uncharacterized protein n=1 Tax=Cylindrotheca closterium TaxID=2856 RepID=A0AAD2CS30_9STRA|nr:unnamed protein product [Cylindrotheca closterium]